MSGIYGCINTLKKNKLEQWNKAYGDSGSFYEKGENYLLGLHAEKLHSKSVCPNGLIKRGSKIWNIDVVLYNRDEIFDILGELLVKKTVSDEELLVNLIDKKGFDILAKVNGDFAGCVYDTETNSLTLFRDHMGVRPLYYYVSDNFVCFSTDLRGVLSVEDVDVSINDKWAYRSYFSLIGYTSTSTEYKYIYCVRPASYLEISFSDILLQNKYRSRKFYAKEYDYESDDSQREYWKSLHKVRITEKKYWHLGERKIRYKTEEEYCSKMRELVEDSVRRRLDSFDGVAGAEFSGGLDSSLISILIKLMRRDAIYCSWSNNPKDQPLVEVDERKAILEICERYSIDCEFLTKEIDFDKFTRLTENTAYLLDMNKNEDILERYAFWPMLNTLHLLNSATYISNKGGKVVFTGHGGDEGISHRPNPFELIYHNEWSNYLDYYCNIRECKNFRFLRGLKRATIECFYSIRALERKKRRTKHIRNYKNNYWQIVDNKFIENGKNIKDIPYTFAYDTVKYILRNGSRNRMDCVAVYGAYCGVRYMFPYLDYRLIDYAVSIERGMYLRHGTNRYVLKKAFDDILPECLKGDINKYDPSFEHEKLALLDLEKRIESIKEKLLTYKNVYGCDEIDGFVSLNNILEEIETKEINEANIDELTSKLDIVIDALKLKVLVDKVRK